MSAQKEKPLNINVLRGSLVAGVVLLASLASTILGVLYYQEPLLANARNVFFLTLGLHEQAPDARAIKNPLRSRNGFLVVDYTIEISNLDLLKDLAEVVDVIAMLKLSN